MRRLRYPMLALIFAMTGCGQSGDAPDTPDASTGADGAAETNEGGVGPSTCGDGACDDGEDCTNCVEDCGACPPDCGDGACGDGEDCTNCVEDCGACPPDCGNGACGDGEDCTNCSADCGECSPGCGDGECDDGEDCSSCEADCGPCPPELADEFYCLAQSSSITNVATEIVTGNTTLADGTPVPDTEVWFAESSYNEIPSGSGIDVRGTTLATPTLGWTQEYRKWYPFYVRGGLEDICVAGGDFLGTLPLDISWADSKGYTPNAVGDNSAPIAFSSINTTVTGVYVTNSHDSIRPTTKDGLDSRNWTLAHSWIEYNRDDCIENDAGRGDGLVYDTLFDGCYVGFSTRDCNDCDRTADTTTLDRVLLRIEPMPFPYKWWERHLEYHLYFEPYTDPVENGGYLSEPGIPFGGGTLFKLNENSDANPRFVIKNTVILFQQWHVADFYAFPPNEIISGCENNTVVWAGNATLAEFQSRFEIPAACEGQISITDDLSVWQDAVADWHARHPNVGKDHKPAVMGDIRIPRWDPQPWPYDN